MSLPEVDSIDDPIAEDYFAYSDDGKRKIAQVVVGGPRAANNDPDGDWMCPVFIDHFTGRIVPAMGVGPVDALKNAMTIVAEFERKVGPVEPRAGSK